MSQNCLPIALLVLAFVWFAGCFTPKSLRPTAADRDAIVTIEDFHGWIKAQNLALIPKAHSLTKEKIAWSHQLTYEYEGAARMSAQEELRVRLRSEVSVHPNAPSALHNANTYWVGLTLGLKKGGASVRRVQPTLDWGDGVDLFVIEKNGHQIGNGFIGHSGRAATYVMITGLYAGDSASFEAALDPKLRALETYDPEVAAGALVAAD